MSNTQKIDYSRFVDDDDEWGSFRKPSIKEYSEASGEAKLKDILNKGVKALRKTKPNV